MPLTVIVTHDVEARYRGFLTSVMLEISAGVYVAPDMSAVCENGSGMSCQIGGKRCSVALS